MLHRRLVQNSGYWTTSLRRLLSTAENIQVAEQKVVKKVSRKKSAPKKNSVSAEVCSYLENSDLQYFIKHLPQRILRKDCKSGSTLCLVNYDVAKALSSMISKDLLENTSYVIECNPGLGLLTQELLDINVPSINVYEKCDAFLKSNSPLTSLLNKYSERLHIKKLNFFDIWMTLLHDKYHNEQLAEVYLSDVPYHDWRRDTFAQIIAICPSRKFFALFMHNFFNQTSIFDHGRPTLYMVLPSLVWNRFITDHTNLKNIRYYTHYNVLLHLFFDYKCIGELPRRGFAPWPAVKSNSKINEIDIPLYVIKIEPKIDTFELIEKDELEEFWYFTKFGMRLRKNKIIMELEKLMPGCGERLIENDIDICTVFKDLSPEQLLKLFKSFRLWPEYDKNLFMPITAVESTDEIKKDEEEKLEEEQESEPPMKDPQTLSSNPVNQENQKQE